VEIRDGSNIVIRNLTVRGANPNAGSAKGAYVADLEGQHGFDVRGTKGITLENVTVTDTYGDLLYLGPGASGWGRDAVVRNSHFERSGRQGIAITGFEDVLVEDSYIGEVGRTIIDIEPFAESGGARRVTFRNNTFGPCRHLWVHSGGRGPNVEDILFEDNQLVGMAIKVVVHTSDASPVGTRRGRHAFIRNISNMTTGGPQPAFRFLYVDGVEVVGNRALIAASREKVGAYACASTDIDIHGNDFGQAIAEYKLEATCSALAEESDE
jgi:polygalacturonase